MNKEQLSDAVGEIRDDFVAEAAPKTKPAHFPVKKILAAAAVLVLAVTAAFAIRALNVSIGDGRPTAPNEGTTAVEATTVPATQAAPEQPDDPPTQAPSGGHEPSFLSFAKVAVDLPEYNNADEFHYKKETIMGFNREDYTDLSFTFFENYANELLLNNGVSNAVASPLNAFFSLAVLSRLTDGDSREQILNALGVGSSEELEKTARALWLANYYNDPINRDFLKRKLIFANSLWVNENNDFTLSDDLKSDLKDDYFTSLFSGDPTDPNYKEAYEAWLSVATDGLLDEQLSQVTLPEDFLLQLESTLLCRLTWSSPFPEENTSPGVFRGQTADATVSFMHKEGADPNAYYFTAEGYTVFGMPTTQADAVFLFLLPNEGVSLESVLKNGALADLFRRVKEKDDLRPKPETDKVYLYNVAVPKFDLTSDFAMKEAFESLGITDVFSPGNADFSPLAGENSGLYLNSSNQNVRLQIDENGISAASRLGDGFGFGDPEIVYLDFTADRPFAFALLTSDGIPLFTGTVTDLPNEE